jgi:hypothetical protein
VCTITQNPRTHAGKPSTKHTRTAVVTANHPPFTHSRGRSCSEGTMAVKKGAGGGGGGEDLKTDPCTVFVRNLPYNLTDEQVRVSRSPLPSRRLHRASAQGCAVHSLARAVAAQLRIHS